ncbi:unnamed protein product [Anisakis simplex]|uniref:Uncharacterized protein n=1 Tax=Anisakis simplex TaxID=6269 RepID=A0A3P6P6S0_ANISI|nr:unnamed protein product [Anisakis simplex]
MTGTRFIAFKTPLSHDFFVNRGDDFNEEDVFEVDTIMSYVSWFCFH